MKRIAAFVLLLCATGVAQSGAPIPDDQVPQRRVILKNNKVMVSLLSNPPGDATPMHIHDKDMVVVFVDGGKIQVTVPGKAPTTDKFEVGEVRFKEKGFTHSTKNLGTGQYRAVIVEFAEPQEKMTKVEKKSRTCTPDK